MKFSTKLLFALIMGLQLNIFSQIPNAGFEAWTDGNPDGWFANNIPGLPAPVTQSTSSHSGSSAARLEIVNFFGTPGLPQLWSGDETLQGFPANERYGSLNGFYQFSPVGEDLFFVFVYMFKGDENVGFGGISVMDAASSYTEFSVPIEYFTAEVPDSALVWFIVGGDTVAQGGNIGSFALIDDLSWGPLTGVHEINNNVPSKFEISQNYPNPFNPSTKINFSITEQSYVDLIVYDILGNEITKLVSNTYSPGEYAVDFNAENLPGGVYIARLTAGKYTKAIKMVLLK